MAGIRSSRILRLLRGGALPADLAAAVVVTALANLVVFAPVVRETPLRIPVGIVFVLFVPGYVIVAALFPERGEMQTAMELESERNGLENKNQSEDDRLDYRVWNAPWPARIDGFERVAYAVGTSLVIVPLVAVSLDMTPWGIRLTPFVAVTSTVTLTATAVAAVRRWSVPESERFRTPYRTWLATVRATLFEHDTRADLALNVLLAVAVLLAVGSVGYAATVLPQDDEFTEMYLLSEDGDGYPTDLEADGSTTVTVGIDNQEGRAVNYTVIVVEQAVTSDGNDTVVEEQQELDRFGVQLDDGETTEFEYEVEPTMTGENVRITWLLYPGDVPEDPSVTTADRYVHLSTTNETVNETTDGTDNETTALSTG